MSRSRNLRGLLALLRPYRLRVMGTLAALLLGTAASLATLGTALTAVIAGIAAKLIFDLSTLEGMLVGAAIAATDSAAIFAVLRGSTVEKRSGPITRAS